MGKQKQSPVRKPEDSIMYKAAIALGILCAGFFLLQLIDRQYGMADLYDSWNLAFKWSSIVCAVLFAAGLAAALAGKGMLRKVGIAAGAVFALLAAASWSLFRFWYEPIGYLYFFLIAGCVLYLISLLYPKDFTVIASLITASGAVFYLHGKQVIASTGTVILYVLIAFALLVLSVLTWKAVANGSTVTIGNKTLRLFRGKAGPLPLYLTVAITAALIIACLLLGGTFAYYCTYAAAGGLFIAACYYTIRLD